MTKETQIKYKTLSWKFVLVFTIPIVILITSNSWVISSLNRENELLNYQRSQIEVLRWLQAKQFSELVKSQLKEKFPRFLHHSVLNETYLGYEISVETEVKLGLTKLTKIEYHAALKEISDELINSFKYRSKNEVSNYPELQKKMGRSNQLLRFNYNDALSYFTTIGALPNISIKTNEVKSIEPGHFVSQVLIQFEYMDALPIKLKDK